MKLNGKGRAKKLWCCRNTYSRELGDPDVFDKDFGIVLAVRRPGSEGFAQRGRILLCPNVSIESINDGCCQVAIQVEGMMFLSCSQAFEAALQFGRDHTAHIEMVNGETVECSFWRAL